MINVRIKVARSELMLATPILAKIAVNAAKLADSRAQNIQDSVQAFNGPLAFAVREQRRLMMGDEGVDHFVEGLARDDLFQLVEREIDAVVGQTALRKIVGADALRTVARADLRAPVGGAFGVEFLPLGVVDPRAQQRHGARPVLVLRTLVLTENDDAGRNMRDADRRFSLIDVLAAGALRAHRVDLQIGFIDIDIDLFGLRENRDGRSRRMDAPLGFGVGHALDPMRAGFEFQSREDAASGDLGDDFFIAAGGPPRLPT